MIKRIIKSADSIHRKTRDIQLENLELFDSCMKQCEISYWASEGTALGLIREGNLILGDSDVDVGMYYENKEKYYKECLPLLLQSGFRIYRQTPHAVIRNNQHIDIDFIGLDKPAMTYNWPEVPNKWFHLIEPFSRITLNDRVYNVPSINYIEYLYGKNWRIPIPHCKPWQCTPKLNS